MHTRPRWIWISITLLLAALPLVGCGVGGGGDKPIFRIVSASENQTLEPLVRDWADDEDVEVEITYAGSVDIMLVLDSDQIAYDAVWPANSM